MKNLIQTLSSFNYQLFCLLFLTVVGAEHANATATLYGDTIAIQHNGGVNPVATIFADSSVELPQIDSNLTPNVPNFRFNIDLKPTSIRIEFDNFTSGAASYGTDSTFHFRDINPQLPQGCSNGPEITNMNVRTNNPIATWLNNRSSFSAHEVHIVFGPPPPTTSANWEKDHWIEADLEFGPCLDPDPEVDIVVEKQLSNSSPVIGDSFFYTVTVTNQGSGTATNIVVNDLLPTDIIYNAHLTPLAHSATYNPNTGNLNIPSLASNEVVTLSINVTVDEKACGQVSNTAALISLDQIDINNSNNESTVDFTLGACPLCPDNACSLACNGGFEIDRLDPAPPPLKTGSISCDPNDAFDDRVAYWCFGPAASSVYSRIVTTASGSSNIGIPVNWVSTQSGAPNGEVQTWDWPAPGNHRYVGMQSQDSNGSVSTHVEGIQTKLVDQLKPNTDYQLEFQAYAVRMGPVGPNPNQQGIIHAFLDETEVPSNDLGATPLSSTTLDLGVFNLTLNEAKPGQAESLWTKITIPFNTGASNNLEHLIIRPFYPPPFLNKIYYFVDDVVLSEIKDLNVKINQTVDNPNPALGETIQYSIEVCNLDANPAVNITIDEILPAGVSYVSGLNLPPSQHTFSSIAGNACDSVVVEATVDNTASLNSIHTACASLNNSTGSMCESLTSNEHCVDIVPQLTKFPDELGGLVLRTLPSGSGSISGSFYNLETDGQGGALQVISDDQAILTFYSYDSQGNPLWLLGIGSIEESTVTFDEMQITSGGMFGPNFNPDDVQRTRWGSATLDFESCDKASMKYESLSGTDSGTLALTRLTGLSGNACRAPNSTETSDEVLRESAPTDQDKYTGLWYDLSHDGEGAVIEMLGDNRALVYWYTYDSAGNQVWILGTGTVSNNTITINEAITATGGVFGTELNPDNIVREPWGSFTISFASCTEATLQYNSIISGFGSGQQNLTRLSSVEGLSCQ